MKKIIVYSDHLIFINGIYTWIINFCKLLKDNYDILVLSKKYSTKVRNEINKVAQTDIWHSDIDYETDTVILNFDFGDIPTNIKAANNYTILHCDYSQVKNKVTINPDTKYIAVSEQAAKAFTEIYGLECDNIESYIPYVKTKKILHLTSCTRMMLHKGAERIYQLANLFDNEGIKYQWLNFSDKDMMATEFIKNHNNPNIIHMPAVSNEDLRDYIADSDYLVQLSDHEGFCFAVHEALNIGTPVITTDIPIFSDLVIDGANGYKVPLDMQNIDINTIANRIPTNFRRFLQDERKIKSKWEGLL